MFSCEFCEISKNTFLIEHLWATPSEHYFVNILFSCTRFDGKAFGDGLIESVKFRKKRAKSSRKIRYFLYYLWARLKEIGSEEQTFTYPASVKQYIRYLALGDIVGEIREVAYKVDLEEFCTALDIPRLDK